MIWFLIGQLLKKKHQQNRKFPLGVLFTAKVCRKSVMWPLINYNYIEHSVSVTYYCTTKQLKTTTFSLLLSLLLRPSSAEQVFHWSHLGFLMRHQLSGNLMGTGDFKRPHSHVQGLKAGSLLDLSLQEVFHHSVVLSKLPSRVVGMLQDNKHRRCKANYAPVLKFMQYHLCHIPLFKERHETRPDLRWGNQFFLLTRRGTKYCNHVSETIRDPITTHSESC